MTSTPTAKVLHSAQQRRLQVFQDFCEQAKTNTGRLEIFYCRKLVAIIQDNFIHYKSASNSSKINTAEWLSTMENRITECNGEPFFAYVVLNYYASLSNHKA